MNQEKLSLPATPVTFDMVESLCQEVFLQREKVDEIKSTLKSEQESLDKLQDKIIETLKSVEKDSYKSSYGTVSISHRFTVSQPKEPEARKQFFEYLKTKGIFEDLISVNSQTLNSFYKQELEAARDKGDIDFQIPGLGEPSYMEIMSMRKNK